jgi:L-glutamine-phosphate cytidylyltransferase
MRLIGRSAEISGMKVVILMAGIGSRLGNALPKCLTPLRADYTILDHQLENLEAFAGNIIAVVGFKRDLILERHPELLFAYNPLYDETNTSQSLLIALRHVRGEDVLFLNGDVVFDPRIIAALLECEGSCMAVVRSRVADEEVKFSLDARGRIQAVSKSVTESIGEAIGINLIRAWDLELVTLCLEQCDRTDYFERGLEIAIGRGLVLHPVDVSCFPCVEIDFIDDLNRAKEMIGS